MAPNLRGLALSLCLCSHKTFSKFLQVFSRFTLSRITFYFSRFTFSFSRITLSHFRIQLKKMLKDFSSLALPLTMTKQHLYIGNYQSNILWCLYDYYDNRIRLPGLLTSITTTTPKSYLIWFMGFKHPLEHPYLIEHNRFEL